MTRPNYNQAPSYTLVQSFAPGLDGDYFRGDIEITDTNDGQFSVATVVGLAPDDAGNTRAARPQGSMYAGELGDGTFRAYHAEDAPHKPKIVHDKHARDRERCKSVAALTLGLSARKAVQLTGEVDGFTSKTGAVWNVDTIATVHIEALDLRADMWILERELRQDAQGGQVTKLTLIPKGFLVLGQAHG